MVNINPEGLRGPKHSLKKAVGSKRILVLGDSFTWGAGVGDDETFSHILETLLQGKAEVINTGVNGYGTDQEFLFLKSEGFKYEPDLVMVTFVPNDIENNLLDFDRGGAGRKPKFLFNNDTLQLNNVPVPKMMETPGPVTLIKKFLQRNFHSYAFLKNVTTHLSYKFSRQPEQLESRSRAQKAKLQEARQTLGFENNIEAVYLPYLKDSTNTVLTEGWLLTQEILKEIDRFCRSIDARMLVVVVASRMEIYDTDWQQAVTKHSLDPARFDMSKLVRMFREFERETKIPVITLSERFREHQGERLYFVHDSHWNPSGHRLTAEIIHEYVTEHEML